MALPEPFSTASPILTNYNWQDVAGGTGYITFYCGSAYNETDGTTYNLSTHQTLSHTQGAWAYKDYRAGENGVQRTINYDVKMNKNMAISGNVLIDHHYILHEDNDNGSSTGYFIFSLINYDGTTEKVLGTADTEHFSLSEETENVESTLILNVEDKEVVSQGNILRLKVEFYISNGEYGYLGISLAVSPRGLEYEAYDEIMMTENTQLKVNIPFEIEG